MINHNKIPPLARITTAAVEGVWHNFSWGKELFVNEPFLHKISTLKKVRPVPCFPDFIFCQIFSIVKSGMFLYAVRLWKWPGALEKKCASCFNTCCIVPGWRPPTTAISSRSDLEGEKSFILQYSVILLLEFYVFYPVL